MARKYAGDLDGLAERFVFRPGWPELIVTPSKDGGIERPDVAAWVTKQHPSISDWFVCERANLTVRS
jgi:hypothetical protein